MTDVPADAREIYPMPMFAQLLTPDPRALADWYATLGFWELFSMPGPDGRPVLVHLRRLRYQDILIVPGDPGDTADRPGMSVSFSADGTDLAATAAKARNHGGGTVEGPTVQPWNAVEIRCTDPDGNVVVLTQPRDRSASFDDVMSGLV